MTTRVASVRAGALVARPGTSCTPRAVARPETPRTPRTVARPEAPRTPRAAARTPLMVACALATFALAACRTQTALDRPPVTYPDPGPAKPEIVRQKNRAGQLTSERHVLVQKGRAPLAHGIERTWYPSGAPEWEREWNRGRPTGTWRRWYENGRLESETTFAGPDAEVPMRFWYEDGARAAEGPARDGSRCGAWRFWRPDGTLREEGLYVDSSREGDWTVHEPDGSTRTVRYERNVIVR